MQGVAKRKRRTHGPVERPRLISVFPRHAHVVSCPHCTSRFELFAADWCGCDGAPRSKVCPSCERCACDHPGYENPRLWMPASPAFVREGFERLFIAYL